MPPETLCKYQPFDKQRLTALINQQIYLSNRKQFNDPYDLYFTPLERDKTEIIKLIRNKPQLLSDGHADMAQTVEIMSDEDIFRWSEEYVTQMYEVANNEVDKYGIYSMCLPFQDENPDNPEIFQTEMLMWSHYADNHRGFCLEFIKDGILKLNKITYVNSIPTIDLFGWSEEQLINFFTTKAKCWDKEQEWRIIDNQKNGLVNYSEYELQLCSVYFGSKMPKEDKEEISKILKIIDSPINIAIYNTQMNPTKFKIDKLKYRATK